MRTIIGCLWLSLSFGALAADPPAQAEAPANPAADKPVTDDSASSEAKPAVQTSGQRRSNDRHDLDTTVVTGNRELPKVLYIVRWKKADIGDLPAQPCNTLVDEALTPVDRDVFRREVTYYGAVSGGGDRGNPASAPQSAGPEK